MLRTAEEPILGVASRFCKIEQALPKVEPMGNNRPYFRQHPVFTHITRAGVP